MLLVKLDQLGVGSLDHVTIAFSSARAQQVRGQRLGSRIDYGSTRHSRAYDRDRDSRRAIFKPAHSLVVGVHVIVDIGARTHLRQSTYLMGEKCSRCRTTRNDLNWHACFGKRLQDATNLLRHLNADSLPFCFAAPNVSRVEHQATELEARHLLDLSSEFDARRPRVEPTTSKSNVEFHEHANGGLLRAGRPRNLPRCSLMN